MGVLTAGSMAGLKVALRAATMAVSKVRDWVALKGGATAGLSVVCWAGSTAVK
jgi:hypothetical protein